MRTILVSVFIMFLSGFAAFAQEGSPAFEMNARLGRGINMGNAFEAPTETAWSNPWKPEYFQIMSELGFSHVRIPIRWETAARSMSAAPYTIEPAFLARIKQAVDSALENKLHAIINMHHHDEFIANPDAQKERFLAQWTQIADFFKDYPDSLLFEVMNEPNGLLTPAKWNEFFTEALGQIRASNPERTVVMGTAEWGGLSALSQLVLPDDPNIILTIHYYSPFTFTHQGAEWVENSTPWLGTKWNDTEAERESVVNDFQYAIQFGAANNVPIHIGEFGAYSKADIASRARWTTFLARWFEEQGFSWAYWEFSAGFGIYSPGTKQLNTALVNALLHNPLPEPTGVVASPVYISNFQSGNDGWNLQAQGGASATLTRASGKLTANITNGGTQNWHVQLIKQNMPLKDGSMYRVAFKASAEEERVATAYLGRASDPWNSYSGYNAMTFTTEEKDYSFTFTMSGNDQSARLVFDLGQSSANFTLASISLEELTLATSVPDTRGENIRYYPNPVKDVMKIENTAAYETLVVTDMLGRKVLSETIASNETGIDLSYVPNGLYVVTLSGVHETSSFTVIKK